MYNTLNHIVVNFGNLSRVGEYYFYEQLQRHRSQGWSIFYFISFQRSHGIFFESLDHIPN